MQLIAEAYSLLNILQKGDHEATAQTFESWNKGVLDSYLIGITAPILRYKDTDGKSLIDKIADRAGQKGTGKWSIEAAIDSGTTLSVTAESVFALTLIESHNRAKQSTSFIPRNRSGSDIRA